MVRKVSREALTKRAIALARGGPLHVSVAAYQWKVSENTARQVLRIAAHISNGQLIYERGVLRTRRGYTHRPAKTEFRRVHDMRTSTKEGSQVDL